MKFLIFNAGSSSIKFKFFNKTKQGFKKIKFGSINRIGDGVPNHKQALQKLIDDHSIDLTEVDIVGHRIVHGGEDFVLPTELSSENLKKLEKYNKLAPLHNPHQISLIKAINAVKGSAPQYGVFDTSFFVDLPEKTKIYPLPINYYREEKIRRYGFHGISHNYLSQVGAKKINLDLLESNLITVHLGAGSSITALKNGSPIDTSMGFTPLEGLMMQTRPGDIDPGILFYLKQELGLEPKQIVDIVNNQSGLKGIAGIGDMKDILFLAGEKVEDPNYKPEGFDDCSQEDIDRAKLALEMFVYRVQKYIGSYRAVLGNLDGLIFGGSIGSGSTVIREKITRDIKAVLKDTQITSIKTDEELQIAKEINQELNK